MSKPERIQALCIRCPTHACNRTTLWRRHPACRIGNGKRDERHQPLRPAVRCHVERRSWRTAMARGVGAVQRGCLCPASTGGRALIRSTVISTVPTARHGAVGIGAKADGSFCKPVQIEPSSALVRSPARSLVMVPAAAGNVARACCARRRSRDGDAGAPVPAAPLSRSRSR